MTGRGVLDQEQAIHLLKAFFGYQLKTVYKHLTKGDGVYWRKLITRRGRAIIILCSLLRVAQHLEADIRSRERFIELPASRLPPSGHLQARHAFLYSTGTYKPFPTHANHPISRKSLEEKTGIEARQQRRYDHVMDANGLVRQPTFAYYRDQSTFKLKSFVRLTETERGLVLTRQLPNRYRTSGSDGGRGMIPRVARRLCVTDKSFIRGEATSTTDRHRRYYPNLQSFIKAALRGKATEGYYPSRSCESKYILEAIW